MFKKNVFVIIPSRLRGQSIVEGLVALSMASIVIVAIIATVTASVATSRISGMKNRANQLAQDGMEIVRSQRNAAEGFYCVGEDEVSLTTPVSPTTCDNEPNIDNTFARSVEIIDNSSTCSSGVREITVSVSWTDNQCVSGEFCQNASLSTCLTDGGVIAGNYPYGPTNTPTNTPPPPTNTPTAIPPTPTNTPIPAPVAINSTSNSGASVSTNNLSWSHTVSGTNRLLIVTFVTESDRNATVTWKGSETFSLVHKEGAGSNQNAYMYSLTNPSTGTGTIQVSLSSNDNIRGGAVSLTGVNQTTPLGQYQSLTISSGTSITSPAIASSTNEKIVNVVAIAAYNSTTTPGSGQTQIWQTASGASSDPTGAASYKNGAASVTTSWSWSTSKRATIIAVPVKP